MPTGTMGTISYRYICNDCPYLLDRGLYAGGDVEEQVELFVVLGEIAVFVRMTSKISLGGDENGDDRRVAPLELHVVVNCPLKRHSVEP